MSQLKSLPHSCHWGAFSVSAHDGAIAVLPHPDDPDPSALLGNIPAAVAHKARIARPMIRRGWLEAGPGSDRRRGDDELVEVSWRQALDHAAGDIRRIYATYGPRAVFGGSYGWASAGRFHDAQHQIHRFLNYAGGYVRSVNSYSSGAATVILPHVIGPQSAVAGNNVSWDELVADSALVLAFGGMALKNNDVGGGGTSRHIARQSLRAARERGVEFHLVGPLRDDLPDFVEAVWHPIRPGTDTALMLGMAYALVDEARYDRAFLDRYCTGWEVFEAYLLGHRDGTPKDPRWAAAICGLPADEVAALARHCVGRRTLVTCSQSLQRAEHGEQPVWMGVVLAAMLGQIGLPGGGFAYALGSTSNTGKPPLAVPLPNVPTGHNGVADFIPVARIADLLLHPGEEFDYDGRRLAYPDIRLVYWAGGNPFHHHQDLGRLRRAFARPDTVIVHDSVWTATAMPTSCCRRRLPSNARISGPPPATRCWWRCTAPSHPMRKRATITTSSPGSPNGSALPRPLPKAAMRANGSSIFTSRPAARSPNAASTHPVSPSFGNWASSASRSSHRMAASSATFAAIRGGRRCRRRAARSRSPRRRSPALAMPIARGIRPGCRRPTTIPAFR
jgi:biotin/methionine sulfoxide reductase